MLPLAPDDAFRHRIPVAGTVILIAAVTLTFLTAQREGRWERRLAADRAELLSHLIEHPAVPVPRSMAALQVGVPGPYLVFRDAVAPARPEASGEAAAAARADLAWLVQRVLATEAERPHDTLGFVPARPQPLALLTHALVQPSWGGLVATLFVLLVLTVLLEEAWGVVLCVTVWLVSAAASVLLVAALRPELQTPLVGGGGAVAGLMGAFIVRFPHRRVRWFWPGPGGATGVALPSWTVLASWLLVMLVAPWIGAPTGVGALRIGTGFAVGAVLALLVARSGWDLALGPDSVELDIAPRGRRWYHKALALAEAGDLPGAERALDRADRLDPRSPAVAGLAWELLSRQTERPDAERFGTRVIQDALARGDVSRAVDTWRAMRHVIGHHGSPAIRWRLAQAALVPLPSRARDLLTGLATDDEAGALRERAQRLLESLSPATGTPPEGLFVGDLHAQMHAAPPATPAPTARPVSESADKAWLEAMADPALTAAAAPLSADDPMSYGATGLMPAQSPPAPADGGWPIPPPPAPRAERGLEVKRASVLSVEPNHLQLARGARFDLAHVEAVSLARIQSQLGEVIIIDLLTSWRGKHAPLPVRSLRLDGATSDLPVALDLPGLEPAAAFVRLARQVVSAAAARALPASLTVGDLEEAARALPVWPSVEAYETSLLGM
ncbi:MAG: rhomboid family intramembrane serine protease [Deltaproteobacteria bacterium]|nr:rhomboid family intramembrane serine protease [Deltaproteobacteria bacterium]MCB9786718.1 rhomboid family intramembrane serine protease [Deltaproteobacteria bacterium]